MKKKTALFRFRPFSVKQKQVITWWMDESPYRDHDMIVCDGAVRSGKTIAMIIGFLQWTQTYFSDEAFIVAGKSMGALKRNVIRPMLQILGAWGEEYNYNRSENYIEFGGNTLYLFGANNEAAQDVLQGLTAAGALLDEVALMPESFIEQAQARCSVENAKLWLNCNPESPFHHVKVELIDKADEKRILHLHFELDDNLTLSEKVKARYRRMFSGVWFKRFILGLWVAAEGAIYDMLDEAVHVVDKLPAMKQYFVGVDYGTGSVTTFWLLGIGVDDLLYFVDFWRWDVSVKQAQRSDVQLCQDMEDWLAGLGVTPRDVVIPDDAQSLIVQMHQTKHKYPHIRHVAIADRSPGSVLTGIRDTATLLHLRYLRFAREVQKKGGLTEWISYVWDPKAQERGEDAPFKKNDHDPDSGRYVISHTKQLWYPLLKKAA